MGILLKTTLWKEIIAGDVFNDVGEIVGYLNEKLLSTEHLIYIVKVIDEKHLESERAAARLKVFQSNDGYNKFQVMLIKPNSTSFVAANAFVAAVYAYYMTCKTQYGTCPLFKRYKLDIVLLKKATLGNDIDKEDHAIIEDFLFSATICAEELIIKSKRHLRWLLMTTNIVLLVVINILQANT